MISCRLWSPKPPLLASRSISSSSSSRADVCNGALRPFVDDAGGGFFRPPSGNVRVSSAREYEAFGQWARIDVGFGLVGSFTFGKPASRRRLETFVRAESKQSAGSKD